MKKTIIDIGADHIRVMFPKDEEVRRDVTAVAIDCMDGKPIGFGKQAVYSCQRMPGSAEIIYPLNASEKMNSAMLEGLFSIAAGMKKNRRFGTDLLISSSVTPENEEAFPEAASVFDARNVYFVSANYAVSRIAEHAGEGATVIVHVGASVSEIGWYVGRECRAEERLSAAGRSFDDCLGDFIYDRYSLLLDEECAQKLKIALSDLSADTKTIKVSGVHRDTRLPITQEMETPPLRLLLTLAFAPLTEAVKQMAQARDEEIGKIVLSGGGAKVCGIKECFAAAFPKAQIELLADPELAVMRGLDSINPKKEWKDRNT